MKLEKYSLFSIQFRLFFRYLLRNIKFFQHKIGIVQIVQIIVEY